MTPEREEKLLAEVSDIHGCLFGIQGQPGSLTRINDDLESHHTRLTRLERWTFLAIGGGAIVVFIIEVAAKAVR